jgi:hypothetical protein
MSLFKATIESARGAGFTNFKFINNASFFSIGTQHPSRFPTLTVERCTRIKGVIIEE